MLWETSEGAKAAILGLEITKCFNLLIMLSGSKINESGSKNLQRRK